MLVLVSDNGTFVVCVNVGIEAQKQAVQTCQRKPPKRAVVLEIVCRTFLAVVIMQTRIDKAIAVDRA
jgi:hypothetical protein